MILLTFNTRRSDLFSQNIETTVLYQNVGVQVFALH